MPPINPNPVEVMQTVSSTYGLNPIGLNELTMKQLKQLYDAIGIPKSVLSGTRPDMIIMDDPVRSPDPVFEKSFLATPPSSTHTVVAQKTVKRPILKTSDAQERAIEYPEEVE